MIQDVASFLRLELASELLRQFFILKICLEKLQVDVGRVTNDATWSKHKRWSSFKCA